MTFAMLSFGPRAMGATRVVARRATTGSDKTTMTVSARRRAMRGRGFERAVVARAGEEDDVDLKQSFPFVKIVAQEELKLALALSVVDSAIGGVLIMGDRGTAKSVSVRSLSQLLPEIDVVEGDQFNSSPTNPELMGPDGWKSLRGRDVDGDEDARAAGRGAAGNDGRSNLWND